MQMRSYLDMDFPARHHSPLPADRVNAQPWLIAGRLLIAPFAPRNGGLTAREVEAIEAMGHRLGRDRCAGLLPDCVAFWYSPSDGVATPLTATGAWLRVTALQHVVIDLHLLQAMQRVVPVTLLLKPPVSGRVPARRVPAKRAGIEAVAAA
jgi:hypothetical protein